MNNISSAAKAFEERHGHAAFVNATLSVVLQVLGDKVHNGIFDLLDKEYAERSDKSEEASTGVHSDAIDRMLSREGTKVRGFTVERVDGRYMAMIAMWDEGRLAPAWLYGDACASSSEAVSNLNKKLKEIE